MPEEVNIIKVVPNFSIGTKTICTVNGVYQRHQIIAARKDGFYFEEKLKDPHLGVGDNRMIIKGTMI